MKGGRLGDVFGGGGWGMYLKGTPPDHFSLGVPEDWYICVLVGVCVSAKSVCVSVCSYGVSFENKGCME